MVAINQSNLTVLNGTAVKLESGAVRLTPKNQNFASGSVFSDTVLNTRWDFSAKFSFQIKDNVRDGADGLTFAIIGNAPAGQIGGNGGALGYGIRSSQPGIQNSIAIEYDTFLNLEYGDPSRNHIGLDINGNLGPASKNDRLPIFDSGKVVYSWINYYAISGRIDVFVNTVDDKNSAILGLRQSINIADITGKNEGYAGFTGATGLDTSTHDILNFELLSYLPNTINPDQDGLEGGGEAAPGTPSEDKITGRWKPKGKLKPSNKKPVSMTILGTPSSRNVRDIDITSIYADNDVIRDGDGATVALNKKRRLSYQYKDYNKDKIKDLRLNFNSRDLLAVGASTTTELSLFGRYNDGIPFAALANTPNV